MIAINPILTVPQIIIAAAAAIGITVGVNSKAVSGKSRNVRGMQLLMSIRIAAIVALALLLLNPVSMNSQSNTEHPPLLILFDSSHSMAIRDVEGKRRFDAGKSALLEDVDLMHRLQQQFSCRLFRVGDTAAEQEISSFAKTGSPDADRTHLGEAIETSLSTVSQAQSGGMVLISDGRNNGEVNPIRAAALAKSRRFPIFTVCLGQTSQTADVAVINHRPQVFAVPEQRIALSADIQSNGYNGETATVDLLREGKTVQSLPVHLDEKHPVNAAFTVTEKLEGTYRYQFSVRPMPNETVVSNNRSAVLLQVLKAQTRVLVLEGRPTWDARFLIKALRTDPSIQVDALFKITADKMYATQGGGANTPLKVPKTTDDLARYDVVIIGKGYEDLFDASGADAIKNYVSDHSGNVIFLRGRAEERADTLKTLEPLQWTDDQINDVRLEITAEGQLNPAFNFRGIQDPQMIVQKLPTMISATRVQGEKALTVVLARAAGVQSGAPDKEMAVVAYQNYGKGKVLSLVGEGLWRWALLPPELKDYTACYNDFWTQLIRWMVNQSDFLPGQDLSLKTDHSEYGSGDKVRLLAFSRGGKSSMLPPVVVTGPDGKSVNVTLGASAAGGADYSAVYQPQQSGEYLASIARPHVGAVVAPFSVYPDREEDRNTAADPSLMDQIARASGGDVQQLDQLRQLPERLHEARATLADTTLAHSAWDRGWVLALLMGLLTFEWILRRRLGLI